MRSVLVFLLLVLLVALVAALGWAYWYFYVRVQPEVQRKWTDPKLKNDDRQMNRQ